jgi:hypothetical protein
MRNPRFPVVLCLAGLAACAFGCSRPPGPKLDTQKITNNRLHGTVSYNGTPLPYGYLKFAHVVDSRNPTTGLYQTTAMTAIGPDGSYTATNLPEGFVVISVFTDPDLGRPTPSSGKPERERHRTGKRGKPAEPKPRNLVAEKLQLQPEQIEMLKQVHEQYGNESSSGLVIPIPPHCDLVFDLDLKTKVYTPIGQ